jgi:hypothetical protein
LTASTILIDFEAIYFYVLKVLLNKFNFLLSILN